MLHRSSGGRGNGRAARRCNALALATLCIVFAAAERVAAFATPPVERVAPGVYVVPGTGGAIDRANAGRVANIAFVVGPRGVVVVGAGVSTAHAAQVIDAVGRVTSRPIRLLVLTHAGREVVLGAAAFRDRRIPVLMHRNAAALMASRCGQCLTRLQQLLGEAAMADSRLIEPEVLVDASQPLDLIGRRLLLVAPPSTAPEGAIAVLDTATGTLLAGSLVTIGRVPDLGDHDGAGWPDALAELEATRCRHLVPALGRLGTCADIDAMRSYFAALDTRVRDLVAADVGLAEVDARADLPRFAAWDGYADLHGGNAQRAYLRLERSLFIH